MLKKLTIVLCLFVPAIICAQIQKLSGTQICIDSQNPERAFDGDPQTYYNSQAKSQAWVGLDLGRPYIVKKVGWMPRVGYPERVQLGLFEGANDPTFTDAIPLCLIQDEGVEGKMLYGAVEVSRGFRYVRYVGPADSRANVSELEFWGEPGSGDDTHFYQLGNIPTLSIHTHTGVEPKDKVTEIDAGFTLVYDGGTRIQEYPILVRGRGNGSWNAPKKPYRIKFNDGKKHHMLKGSPLESPAEEKKWTLLNSFGDKTMMRNSLAYEVSRRFGMPYTVYCQPVDVIMNGEYKGCYQLCDQITVGESRVDITKMKPSDEEGVAVTGGYLLEIDAYASSEKSKFVSPKGVPVTIKYPDEDEITEAQHAYIERHFGMMEKSLWDTDYDETVEGFRSRLDVESYVKHFLVGEFSGNTDTYWSQYLYKDRGTDQFVFGPSWDFDLAFENDSRTYPINSLTDWVFNTKGSYAGQTKKMVNRIISDSTVVAQMRNIWTQARKAGGVSEESLIAYIDSMQQMLATSAKLNFTRWKILDQLVQQNPIAYGSFDAEVDALRKYIVDRITWMDNKLAYPSIEIARTVLEIRTPQQLVAFADSVNAGNVHMNAVLCADLDMGGFVMTPIGNDDNKYVGSFNGQGHRICNLHIEGKTNIGLFGTISGGAHIANFIFDKSCTLSGRDYTAIIATTNGPGLVVVENIGNEADISGTKNASGIVGSNRWSQTILTIRNCYNTGTITGSKECAAICGWTGGYYNVHDCWNSGVVTGYEEGKDIFRYGGSTDKFRHNFSTMGTQGTIVEAEDVRNGMLCYMLNRDSLTFPVWYQKIGEDAHPTFDYNRGVVWKEESGQFSNRNYLLGDVNCDGAIDEKDIELTANYVLGRTADIDMINADPNRDGRVDVLEMIQMLRLKDGKEILTATNITARLSTDGVSLGLNESVKVPLMLYASEPVSVLQADIVVPKGLTLDEAETARGALLESGHRIEFATIDDGYRIVVYSPDLAELTATSGVLASMVWKSDDTFNGGKIKLKNQVLGTKANGQCRPSDAKSEIALVPTLVAELLAQQTSYELELGQNETANLNVTVLPETATDKSLSYKSSAPAIVDVNKNGFIRAYEEGSSVITITAKDGSNVSTSVTVTVLPDSSSLDEVNDPTGCATIYDTNGIRITQMRRGRIYIVGGKRIMIQ